VPSSLAAATRSLSAAAELSVPAAGAAGAADPDPPQAAILKAIMPVSKNANAFFIDTS
jgi:hypothetical protein